MGSDRVPWLRLLVLPRPGIHASCDSARPISTNEPIDLQTMSRRKRTLNDVSVDQRRRYRRAGIGARRRARRETWTFVRQRRIWLVVLGMITLLVTTVLGAGVLQEAVVGRPMAAWWTPFLLGLVLGAFPCLVWGALTSADGSASWRIGAQAEQWTAEELEGLGPSWRIEHNVPFPGPSHVVDVDHVAVGPHGVLAMETKWTSHAVDLGARRLAPEVAKAIEQARANAGRVRGLLRRVNVATDVIPVVVYWGPKVTPPPISVRREDGVRLVAGRRGSEWRPLLSLDRLDEADIDRLASRVRDWRAEHEEIGVRVAVAARLRHADRLGRVSIGLAMLMVILLPLSRASDFIDDTLRLGGGGLAASVILLPPVTGLAAAAYLWLARQLDPEVAWIRRLAPLGVWSAGFVGLVLATP